jgi:hypothetical protein
MPSDWNLPLNTSLPFKELNFVYPIRLLKLLYLKYQYNSSLLRLELLYIFDKKKRGHFPRSEHKKECISVKGVKRDIKIVKICPYFNQKNSPIKIIKTDHKTHFY